MGSGSPLFDFIENLKEGLTEVGQTIADKFDEQWYEVTKLGDKKFDIKDIFPTDDD